jgi:N-acetylgalactosamine-N,N'-diacetylbacillosaminyl-diphospho-undecaprenol 4-alpha-N-acetylgalactosaminyltransferase
MARHDRPRPAVGEAAGTGRRPRILFVINSLAGGGAERVMATLLRNSKDRLESCDFALAVLDDDPPGFALPSWLTIFQLDCRHGTLRSIFALDRLVRRYDPDVTLSFLTRANLSSGIAMMKRGRPWIISERTSTSAHLGSGLRQSVTKSLIRLVYPRASRVIAVSAGVAAKLSKSFAVPTRKVDVIPNPVDIAAIEADAREPNPLPVDEPYIIAIGRLVPVKNYRLLVEAFARAGLPCRLVIAGDGPERDALRLAACELGVEERVLLPGWLSNPYPALSGARLFALSSNVEGFPNALVEALALGVPAAATNCSDGPAEILAGKSVDQVSGVETAAAGILAPVGDADSFAEALKLAFDPSIGKRLAQRGRKRARDFSAGASAVRYWGIIEQELAQAGAAPASRGRSSGRQQPSP